MKTIHMIGNGHIDPVWLWRWQEGFQEIKATFQSALDRMEENEDFYFSTTSTAFFEWIEQNNPKMFEKIQERVKQGRWEILGGWYVEPDCNLADGESYIRQGLYGQRYLKEKFSKIATVGCNPDSFGHNAMLPQILLKQGINKYMFMRPNSSEGLQNIKEDMFFWQAPDNSIVQANRITEPYNTNINNLQESLTIATNKLKEDDNNVTSIMYGVGNHGGGPTKETIKAIKETKLKNINVKMSTTEQLFTEYNNKINLQTVSGELQHHANGCYSVNSKIKTINSKAEQLLMASEKFSVITKKLLNTNYNHSNFTKAWKNVLFNQFHDILAGTSIKSACDDAIYSYGEAISISERELNNSMQAISWDINIPIDLNMTPIVIFNPHSWSGKKIIEIESSNIDIKPYILDEKNEEINVQIIQSEVSSITHFKRNKIVFTADIPALGYKTFRIFTKEKTPANIRQIQTKISPTITENYTLENENLSIKFNPKTGNILHLFDKINKVYTIEKDTGEAIAFDDKSDTWAHGINKFKNYIGKSKLKSIKLIEDGEVRKTIRVKKEFPNSKLCFDYTLYKELDYIEVKLKINWQEKQTGLKLQYITELQSNQSSSSIAIARQNTGVEEPTTGWVDYSDDSKNYGISFISNNIFSYDIEDNKINLTLLRNPIYANHVLPNVEGEYIVDNNLDYDYTDSGEHEFKYYIYPHKDTWNKSKVVKLGLEIKQPLLGINESYHNGSLKQSDEFVNVSVDNIIISVIKQSEDKTGTIIRLREINGIATNADINLNFLQNNFNLKFSPYEIKTIKISDNNKVQEVNMLEYG